jgi:uncharacterized SAM-binding protein YcdF (DUF218 family)
MEPGELKPILKAVFMPPAGLLLLAAVGMAVARVRRRTGAFVTLLALVALWLLGCNGFAVALHKTLLPQFPPIDARELDTVQAIVVIGGGAHPDAPEYGEAQPSYATLRRLRYAVALARRSGKPLAFASGTGWGGVGPSEAEIAQRVLSQDYGASLRWIEDRSRDTRENARAAAVVLSRDKVRRIALVTDSTHMPRAARNFTEAGFDVVPAPTAYMTATPGRLLDWLPSPDGLRNSYYVLHEWLGLRLT